MDLLYLFIKYWFLCENQYGVFFDSRQNLSSSELSVTAILLTLFHFFLRLGTPKDIKYNSVKMSLESIEGVVAAHSLHIWSLTVNKAALAVHLAIGI